MPLDETITLRHSLIGFVPELELGFVFLTNSTDAAEAFMAEAPTVLIESFETSPANQTPNASSKASMVVQPSHYN